MAKEVFQRLRYKPMEFYNYNTILGVSKTSKVFEHRGDVALINQVEYKRYLIIDQASSAIERLLYSRNLNLT